MIQTLALVVVSGALARDAARPESAALLSAVLFGNPMAPEAAVPTTDPELKKALARYRARERQFKGAATENPKNAKFQKTIFSLFDRPDASRLGSEFASSVTLFREWEGMEENPLAEGQSAESFLQSHPKTPLESYLHLFIGHRYRCVLEFVAGREGAAPDLSKKAALHLEEAKKSDNILIQRMAAHLSEFGGCFSP